MPGPYRCIRLISRAWKTRLYRLPPKKDYHVYITHGIYHYAYAQQAQVEWKEETKNKEEKGTEIGAWGQEKEKKNTFWGSTGESATRTGCRGFSTVYSSITNDFPYTLRSTDCRPITRWTAGRGCHVSLCWVPLCPASCWLLFEVKHAMCSMVSRQQHTRTSARTTYHSYRKCNIFSLSI